MSTCANFELHASLSTGKERDTESGLDYFGARYYASNMGRWMSPDWADKPEAVPYSHLDNPQSLNLYGYVLNNPLSKPDLDGHGCPPDCGDPTLPDAVAPPPSLLDRFMNANAGAVQKAGQFVRDHPEAVASFVITFIADVISGEPEPQMQVPHEDLTPIPSAAGAKSVPESIPTGPTPQAPLIDPETEAWIADWSDWSISSSSGTFCFRPSKSEYSTAGIRLEDESGPGSLPQKDVLRFFIAKQTTSSLFLPEKELIGELEGCPQMRLLLQTESWQHPDVANGELPSETRSFQSLMKVIAEKSASLFVPGNVNTSWPVWDHDAEK